MRPEVIFDSRQDGVDNIRLQVTRDQQGDFRFFERTADNPRSRRHEITEAQFLGSFAMLEGPNHNQPTGPPLEVAPPEYAVEATPLTWRDHPDHIAEQEAHRRELLAHDWENMVFMATRDEQHEQQMGTLQAQITDLQNQINNPQNNQGGRVRRFFGRVFGRRPEVQPEADALEAQTVLDNNFEEARDGLVEQTDRRKARTILQIFRRRQESNAYDEALTNFNEQLDTVLAQRRAAGLAAGMPEEQIDEAQHAFVFNQRLDLAHRGREHARERVANLGGIRGWFARRGQSWAEVPTIAKMGVAGATAALISLGAATLGVGIGVIIAGAGIKMSMAYFNREANVRNVSMTRLRAEQARIQRDREEARNQALAGNAQERDEQVRQYLEQGERAKIRRDRIVNTIGKVAVFGGIGIAAYGVATMIDGGLPHIDSILGGSGGGKGGNQPGGTETGGTGNGTEAYPNGLGPQAVDPNYVASHTHLEHIPDGHGGYYPTTEVQVDNADHLVFVGHDDHGDNVVNLVNNDTGAVRIHDIEVSDTGAVTNGSIESSNGAIFHGPNDTPLRMHTLYDRIMHFRHPSNPTRWSNRTISTLLENTDELKDAA